MRSFLMACLLALPLGAQPYDAVISGENGWCGPVTPLIIPTLEWIDEASSSPVEEYRAVAPAGEGRLFALDGSGRVFEIARGVPSRVVATLPAEWSGYESDLVVDRAGNIYVLAGDIENALIAFDPAGALRWVHPLGQGYYEHAIGQTSGLDLAADQCTLYLIRDRNPTTIRRFNVCTETFGPDFASLVFAADVRVLPDGGLLVLSVDDLYRYDAGGTLRETFELDGDYRTLALAAHGRVAWLGGYGCRSASWAIFSLQSQTTLRSGTTRVGGIQSIVPFNVWTAALGSAVDIPTVSPLALLALAGLLSLLALRRLM